MLTLSAGYHLIHITDLCCGKHCLCHQKHTRDWSQHITLMGLIPIGAMPKDDMLMILGQQWIDYRFDFTFVFAFP